MPRPNAITELMDPLSDLKSKVAKLHDDDRIRFIGCALEAASLAVSVDKSKTDIKATLKASIDMMNVCLEKWAEKDGL